MAEDTPTEPTESPVPWLEGADADTAAYVTGKGWESPKDLFTSYRNLEKLSSGSTRVVALPGDEATEEDLGKFYTALGRPNAPEEYGYEVPEEADADLDSWFRQTAHEAGLSNAQATKLFGAWQEMSGTRIEQMENAAREQGEKDIAALQREWGKDFDKKLQAGKNVVRALGLDQDRLASIESKLGTGDMTRLFVELGTRIGEDDFIEGARSPGFDNGAAAAKAQVDEMMADPQIRERLMGGDKDLIAKRDRLYKQMYPE